MISASFGAAAAGPVRLAAAAAVPAAPSCEFCRYLESGWGMGLRALSILGASSKQYRVVQSVLRGLEGRTNGASRLS